MSAQIIQPSTEVINCFFNTAMWLEVFKANHAQFRAESPPSQTLHPSYCINPHCRTICSTFAIMADTALQSQVHLAWVEGGENPHTVLCYYRLWRCDFYDVWHLWAEPTAFTPSGEPIIHPYENHLHRMHLIICNKKINSKNGMLSSLSHSQVIYTKSTS